MNRFNVQRHQVEQEGSKQCAVVYLDSGAVFVSYTSIVGFSEGGQWYFTEEKHSVTTSCQVSAFHASREYLPELVFDDARAGDATNVIAAYNKAVQQRCNLIRNFEDSYYAGMKTDATPPHLVSQAAEMLELNKSLFNRITRETKQNLISNITSEEAHSGNLEKRYYNLEKRYNKFKAKLTKVMKA